MSEFFDPGEIAQLVSREELTLERAKEVFETIFMPSRNYSSRTRTEYSNDLHQLIPFLKLKGITKPQDVSLRHLQAFFADLDARGFTGVTRRRKAASIRTFFHFLTATRLIRINPTLQLIPPEREYNEPRFLSSREYQALLRACSYHTRDAAIIELVLQTGIRLTEIARLTIYDVELPATINRDPSNAGSLHIKGKGRKNRTILLNYKACRVLKAWLAIRPDITEPALFASKLREPLGKRGIERLVAKYLKEAGIRDASVHTLRHTMATHHAAKGTSLESIRQMLGHADLKTTSIYISTAKEAMKKELQNNAL